MEGRSDLAGLWGLVMEPQDDTCLAVDFHAAADGKPPCAELLYWKPGDSGDRTTRSSALERVQLSGDLASRPLSLRAEVYYQDGTAAEATIYFTPTTGRVARGEFVFAGQRGTGVFELLSGYPPFQPAVIE